MGEVAMVLQDDEQIFGSLTSPFEGAAFTISI